MDTRGPAASTGTPGNSPRSPSASAWSASAWWTWRTCVTPWTRPLSERSTSTWRREPGSSWSWTSRRRPPCLCTSTRSRAARWCGGTSAGRSASACAGRWTECHLSKREKTEWCETYIMLLLLFITHRALSLPSFLSDTERGGANRGLTFMPVIVLDLRHYSSTSVHIHCMLYVNEIYIYGVNKGVFHLNKMYMGQTGVWFMQIRCIWGKYWRFMSIRYRWGK